MMKEVSAGFMRAVTDIHLHSCCLSSERPAGGQCVCTRVFMGLWDLLLGRSICNRPIVKTLSKEHLINPSAAPEQPAIRRKSEDKIQQYKSVYGHVCNDVLHTSFAQHSTVLYASN